MPDYQEGSYGSCRVCYWDVSKRNLGFNGKNIVVCDSCVEKVFDHFVDKYIKETEEEEVEE